MASARELLRLIRRSLRSLRALHFVGEGLKREHDLVSRRVECALTAFEVKEHTHASSDELLKRVRGFDRLSTKA
jgi:hypothetical protein